ncbi:aldose epimerase family protein [Lacticaseibacillus sp. GG6-2]
MNTVENFGGYRGQPVYRYTVTNDHGATISCLSLGAVWQQWAVPVAGRMRDLILRSPEADDYVDDFSHHGQAIGRMAGRIPTTFSLGGQLVSVAANDGPINLHGGANGFYALNWEGRIDGDSILFTRLVTPEDDDFPGNMQVTIRYTLTEADDVVIDYSATSDAVSLFNPMNHAYFNLNATDAPVRNHTLWLNSNARFALEASKLPRAELVPTAGTPYDFSQPKPIGTAIDGLQNIPEHGIDDVYYAPEATLQKPVATLCVSDLAVDFYSDRNAVVVYSANNWGTLPRLSDRTTQDQAGIAIELQTAPSALRDDRFGDLTIKPDQPRHYQSQYRLRR